MAKIQIKTNPRTNAVFKDLDAYRDFCRDYGYKFNEGDLYNIKAYPFQQYTKFAAGKNAKDMWTEDAKRFGREIS